MSRTRKYTSRNRRDGNAVESNAPGRRSHRRRPDAPAHSRRRHDRARHDPHLARLAPEPGPWSTGRPVSACHWCTISCSSVSSTSRHGCGLSVAPADARCVPARPVSRVAPARPAGAASGSTGGSGWAASVPPKCCALSSRLQRLQPRSSASSPGRSLVGRAGPRAASAPRPGKARNTRSRRQPVGPARPGRHEPHDRAEHPVGRPGVTLGAPAARRRGDQRHHDAAGSGECESAATGGSPAPEPGASRSATGGPPPPVPQRCRPRRQPGYRATGPVAPRARAKRACRPARKVRRRGASASAGPGTVLGSMRTTLNTDGRPPRVRCVRVPAVLTTSRPLELRRRPPRGRGRRGPRRAPGRAGAAARCSSGPDPMRCEMTPGSTLWCSTTTRPWSARRPRRRARTRSTSLAGRWPFTAMSLRLQVIDPNATPWPGASPRSPARGAPVPA